MNPASPPAALCRIAREAIAAHLRAEPYDPPALDDPFRVSRGVFVTLQNADGSLRGCIGHLEPVHATLEREIASCAVSAAVRDPRFAPVALGELPALRIELSLMTPPEPIADPADLDPARYGVVVSWGARRGVLLPDIEGIEHVDDQLRIAARKADIPPGAPLSLARFEVLKVGEARAS